MVFKKEVINIQTGAYNGACMVKKPIGPLGFVVAVS